MAIEADEIELTLGERRAWVSSHGASLRRYFLATAQGEVDVLWGYSGTANKKGGQGDVLIPFPGRLVGGRYAFGGKTHQMKQNDKDGPNAIHGFLRTVPWEISARGSDRVEFRKMIHPDEFEGYPFSVEVTVAYELGAQGLECRFTLRNSGADAAPVGAGFHPYFTAGTSLVDESLLKSPAEEVIELGPNLLPTGKILPIEGNEMDFRVPRAIGALKINHCLAGMKRDADGLARVELSNPEGTRRITVWMDSSFPYVVLYSGDAIPGGARQSLAIEPMTCATDAFNRPDWGLKVLKPGTSFSGRYGVSESFNG